MVSSFGGAVLIPLALYIWEPTTSVPLFLVVFLVILIRINYFGKDKYGNLIISGEAVGNSFVIGYFLWGDKEN